MKHKTSPPRHQPTSLPHRIRPKPNNKRQNLTWKNAQHTLHSHKSQGTTIVTRKARERKFSITETIVINTYLLLTCVSGGATWVGRANVRAEQRWRGGKGGRAGAVEGEATLSWRRPLFPGTRLSRRRSWPELQYILSLRRSVSFVRAMSVVFLLLCSRMSQRFHFFLICGATTDPAQYVIREAVPLECK